MTTIIRDNERSHAIDLISKINFIASKYNLLIKRAGGERTISTKNKNHQMLIKEDEAIYGSRKQKIMFPDVILYGDNEKTQILQGWELKLPDTLITDVSFIKDAQRKALALGLNSCFIWNFTSGVLYKKNELNQFVIVKQWNNTSHIRSREDVERCRADWENEIQSIVIEINNFFSEGKLAGASLSEIISDNVLAALVYRNKECVANTLKEYAIKNMVVKAYVEQWWREIESEYVSDENSMFNAYAKIVIVNWSNRIIFAHLIKKYHNAARKILNIDFSTTQEQANDIFNEITRECDFYNVFSAVEFNTIIPKATWHDMVEFNMFLAENGVEEIEQSSLQKILEGTVSAVKREISGQFTTPPKLAEILSKITILNLNGNIIDPCCGTGTIPKEVLYYKKEYIEMKKAVNTTWASDKYLYPLQIANISLTSSDTINIPSRIFKQNALSLNECKVIKIVNPINGALMDIDVPKFDVVLSNLPFISFEQIKKDDKDLVNRIISEVKEKSNILLSLKSDIYCFLIFSLYRVISENGRAGFITSNSWLGTVWGREFYRALTHYFKIEQVHISKNKKWFSNAKVITTILVLSKKKEIVQPDNDDVTLFFSWKKSLDEIQVCNKTRDNIVNSSLLGKIIDKNSIDMSKYHYSEIYKLLELNLSLNALFHEVKWLNEISKFLIPIKSLFNIIRGERRGWDDMFYPENGHGIEEKYIKKVLKNARGVNTLIALPDNDAFCCNDSLEKIKEENGVGALCWIGKYETVTNGVGKLLPEVLKRSNMHWYQMKDDSTAEIFTMMNPDKRLFFAKFSEPTFINQRLIGLSKKDESVDIELSHALLNSILSMFYIEAVGFGRGLGVLDISKGSISNSFVLNPKMIKKKSRSEILEKFKPILNREILSTTEELQQLDRMEFDRTVLRAFGIEKFYYDIKKSLVSMQNSRSSV